MWGQFGEVAAICPVFGDKKDGFFVDVGAFDGVRDSNTLFFERLGWKGICVEPHKWFYSLLVKNRPNSICLDCAVWSEELEEADFHATGVGGWSRLWHPLPKADHPIVEIQKVKTRILNNILDEFKVPAPFDLLSIDVEGSEQEVLKGFDLEKYLPRIIIIEDLSLKGQFDEYFGLSAYRPIYSWHQGKGGSNIIYCREEKDAEIVQRNWR